jgi:dipeptidyl aminopeptidase/acylaminoacyl peptidase
MALAPGAKLDSYEVLGLLGAGGMGEVYRARDPVLRREVAIKVLPSFVSQDPDRLRRFEQEAQAAAALNHPNILAVHQFGVFESAPYLVSELLVGCTLRQLLQRGPMPVRKAIDYGVQIAHGLAAAHEKGIVHRDLKPENLFVTKDGRVKILDFGLAKLMQHGPDPNGTAPTIPQNTDPGMVMGTAGYMSPEQVRGETVDHRTDIFAFGATLYEMLSGTRAFNRSTSAETMTAILNDEPPSISQIVQSAPPGLQRVVHRCLEKNPEQRFQSASDLAFALEALSESGSGPAVAIGSQASRSSWIGVAVGTAALVVIAALILWWRIPAAVPVVESVTPLTGDGHPKRQMATDGLRIYFQDPEALRIGQVSVAGGATAPVETSFVQSWLAGITHDSSALLVAVPVDSGQTSAALWLVPVPAGEPRRLGSFFEPIEPTSQADLFPDGRVVFAELSRQGAYGTDWSVAERDGSNRRKLVSLLGFAGNASVSPDGQRIILTEEQPSNRRLFEIAADGTGLHEIRRLSGDERNFRWTPDGKYLVYQTGNEPQSDIWLLPMKTGLFRRVGEPTRLTNGPLPYSFPCPSRDGKQVFVLGSRPRGELVHYDMKSNQFVPFLSGISATDPTFSRDGKWVAYLSFPDHMIWRSRSDGSERTQLTYPPMLVGFPSISPDGTKVAFSTVGREVFLVSMEGGTPQKIVEDACCATWSPDGNFLFYKSHRGVGGGMIADLRFSTKSAVPFSNGIFGFWLNQDTLIAPNEKGTSFVTFNRKTGKWTELAPVPPGGITNWMMSPDYKYMYFSTAGAEPKAMRLRIANHQIETITSLKDFHRLVNGGNTQINVAPDGSPIFTRDTGYQEIYALSIRWP